MKNKIRTSAEVASIAAHLIKGMDVASVRRALEDAVLDLWIEDLVQSLSGSVLANRRA